MQAQLVRYLCSVHGIGQVLENGIHRSICQETGTGSKKTKIGKLIDVSTCLLAKTSRTASRSSSSASILISSSRASFTRSRSLLSTTKIKPVGKHTSLHHFRGQSKQNYLQDHGAFQKLGALLPKEPGPKFGPEIVFPAQKEPSSGGSTCQWTRDFQSRRTVIGLACLFHQSATCPSYIFRIVAFIFSMLNNIMLTHNYRSIQ